eukprot:6682632-Pyramimonas_sp.AAC.1
MAKRNGPQHCEEARQGTARQGRSCQSTARSSCTEPGRARAVAKLRPPRVSQKLPREPAQRPP